MIYNVPADAFGPLGTRNGDLIAICNIIEWMRKRDNNPSIQFYLPHVLNKDDYIHKFYNFLCNNTDYLSVTRGDKTLPFHNIGVWDFRSVIGDNVIIKNNKQQQKKVVIFPLYDGSYNTQRNWPKEELDRILNDCREKYSNYEKIICCKDIPPEGLIDTNGYKFSTDFMDNINHIMTCEVFYAGDTGVSHFASVLEPGPKELNYVYSPRCLIHTIPFYCISKGKGNLITFWADYVGGAKWGLK